MLLKIQATGSQPGCRAVQGAMNPLNITYKITRRIAVAIVGLVILGLEFAWARSWLKGMRESISAGNSKTRAERTGQHRRR